MTNVPPRHRNLLAPVSKRNIRDAGKKGSEERASGRVEQTERNDYVTRRFVARIATFRRPGGEGRRGRRFAAERYQKKRCSASKAVDRSVGWIVYNHRFNHPESVFAGNYNAVTPSNWPSLILCPTYRATISRVRLTATDNAVGQHVPRQGKP